MMGSYDSLNPQQSREVTESQNTCFNAKHRNHHAEWRNPSNPATERVRPTLRAMNRHQDNAGALLN